MADSEHLTDQVQVESPHTPLLEWLSRDKDQVRLNAQEVLERHANERAQAAKDRQEGRLKGELTHSLMEKLEACTPQQLEEVVRRARHFQERYRKPPALRDCRVAQTVQVLKYVPVREKLYTLEFRRSSKRGNRVYVNGPYVICHWRDGNLVKHQHSKKKLLPLLPKKVRGAFNPIIGSAATEELRRKLDLEWANRTGPD